MTRTYSSPPKALLPLAPSASTASPNSDTRAPSPPPALVPPALPLPAWAGQAFDDGAVVAGGARGRRRASEEPGPRVQHGVRRAMDGPAGVDLDPSARQLPQCLVAQADAKQ